MKLKPLYDWAVVLPSGAEEMSAGGIYIPDTARSKPHEGVVESVGPGAYEEEKRGKKKDKEKKRRFIPTTVKPGDLVLYERYGGQTYTIDNEERILVRERDILGVLPERQALRPSSGAAKAKDRPPKSADVSASDATSRASGLKDELKQTAKKALKRPSPKALKKTAKKAVKKAVKTAAKTSPSRARGGKGKAGKRGKEK